MPEWPGKPIGSPKPLQAPVESDNILLKVCPRCGSTHSRYDTNCGHCAKLAKIIGEKLPDIRKRFAMGEPLSEGEQKLMKGMEEFLHRAGLDEESFLAQAPFPLPEETRGVRPTFRNRLLFFVDRMQQEGRQVTTTSAAARLLKFNDRRNFVDFATDHGMRPLMSADSEQLYAAWRIEDVLKLLHERQAEKATTALVEREPGQMVGTMEASRMLGIPGSMEFMDLAGEFGIEPAKSFGDKPEQMAWRIQDVEALRSIHVLDKEALAMEEKIQRIDQDIAKLQAKPMKWPEMKAFQEKTKERELIRHELAKIDQRIEQEGRKLQEAAAKRQETPKEASERRLALLLSFS